MLLALLAPLLSMQLLCDAPAPAAHADRAARAADRAACAADRVAAALGAQAPLEVELAQRIVRVQRTAGPMLRTDTLFVVRKGTSLELNNFAGVINVNAWNRDAVRVQAEHSRRDRIVLELTDKTLEVSSQNRLGMPSMVNYYLTVPQWMPLELSGINTEIAVNNVKAAVNAESVSGDVLVRGASGPLELSSIEGTVRVMDSAGGVRATSVNSEVRLERIAGQVSCESVNGNIRLEQIDSGEVRASSMNGMVLFLGDFQRQGHYALTSHQGNIVVGVPENAGLDVSVVNFLGGFRSGFPLKDGQAPRRTGEFNFTLGRGGSSLNLESYQGLIQLLRPAELKARLARLAPEAPAAPSPAPAVPAVPEWAPRGDR